MTNGERPEGPTDRIERIEAALEILIAKVDQTSVDVNTLRAITLDNERRRESTEYRLDALIVEIREQNAEFRRRMDEHSAEIRGLQTDNRRILDILQRRQGDDSP